MPKKRRHAPPQESSEDTYILRAGKPGGVQKEIQLTGPRVTMLIGSIVAPTGDEHKATADPAQFLIVELKPPTFTEVGWVSYLPKSSLPPAWVTQLEALQAKKLAKRRASN